MLRPSAAGFLLLQPGRRRRAGAHLDRRERQDVQLGEEALGRAAKGLAVAKSVCSVLIIVDESDVNDGEDALDIKILTLKSPRLMVSLLPFNLRGVLD